MKKYYIMLLWNWKYSSDNFWDISLHANDDRFTKMHVQLKLTKGTRIHQTKPIEFYLV